MVSAKHFKTMTYFEDLFRIQDCIIYVNNTFVETVLLSDWHGEMLSRTRLVGAGDSSCRESIGNVFRMRSDKRALI